jgi:hypothetical protein
MHISVFGATAKIGRVTNPTDRAAKGTRRVGYLARDNVGSATSRVDIAAFLVDQTHRHDLPESCPGDQQLVRSRACARRPSFTIFIDALRGRLSTISMWRGTL